MKRRFKVFLPLMVGSLNALLTVWDYYNQRVIESMGRVWDTGAPVWPYQTPEILLFALNAPAYAAAMPITKLLRNFFPWQYLVLLPVSLAWWWFVGLVVDSGVGKKRVRARWIWFAAAVVVGCSLCIVGVAVFVHPFQVWFESAAGLSVRSVLVMVRMLAPAIWVFVLGIFALVLAKRFATEH